MLDSPKTTCEVNHSLCLLLLYSMCCCLGRSTAPRFRGLLLTAGCAMLPACLILSCNLPFCRDFDDALHCPSLTCWLSSLQCSALLSLCAMTCTPTPSRCTQQADFAGSEVVATLMQHQCRLDLLLSSPFSLKLSLLLSILFCSHCLNTSAIKG